MTLRLWLYKSNAGRWRRRTRYVNALRRPLAFREELLGWSRRAILALAALVALAVMLLALLTPVVVDALRGAALEPGVQPTFCDKDPFTLDGELFVCAPAGTQLPPWSRLEEPVEFATHLDNILTSIWSGAWSFVECVKLELGSLLSSPAWSTLEALEQPGDPQEAWLLLPRSVPSLKTPTNLTPSSTTWRGNDPFNHNLVSAVKAALTRGPHWRSTCAGLAADSRVAQAVCSGFTTWQSAVVHLQSAGPAAQLLPLLCSLCILALSICIYDDLVDDRAVANARAESDPAQIRPRGQFRRPAPNVQPGRHTPGKMNRRKRRSRRHAETADKTPSFSPEESTSGVTEEVTQTANANADATQVSPDGPVEQPSGVQEAAAKAACTSGEPANVTQADEGAAQGVASPVSPRRGFVATTCNFVVRASGIPARLISFVFFLLLNVSRFFFLAFLSILCIPVKFFHFSTRIIWHFVVTLPLYCICALLWICLLPLRGVLWVVLGALVQLGAGVMNLSHRAAGVPFRPAVDPPGPATIVPEAALQSTELVDPEQVRECACATCRFFALLNPAQHPDSQNNCPDCVLVAENTTTTKMGIKQHITTLNTANKCPTTACTDCCMEPCCKQPKTLQSQEEITNITKTAKTAEIQQNTQNTKRHPLGIEPVTFCITGENSTLTTTLSIDDKNTNNFNMAASTAKNQTSSKPQLKCCTSPSSSQPAENCCLHQNKSCVHAINNAAAPSTSNTCAPTASSIPRAIALGSEEPTRAAPGSNETPCCQADTTHLWDLFPRTPQ
jgi:hypothetical protein